LIEAKTGPLHVDAFERSRNAGVHAYFHGCARLLCP